jgi:hypothetical protein
MPKVLLTQDLIGKKNLRTVVDGQQRIRTILEFVAGSFTVLQTHNSQYAGIRFSELEEETQAAILQYEVGVDLLYSVSLPDMLDIFARINTYSVTLNRQEQLNAKYLGVFKTTAYDLGHAYIDYVLDGGILTEKKVSRMGEAELASDLLVAIVGGVQTIKSIEKYYKQFEDLIEVPTQIVDAIEQYRQSMQYIGAIYTASDLKATNWSRSHWFYTLFTCVSHALSPQGLIGLEDAPKPTLTSENLPTWRGALDEISAQYNRYTEPSGSGDPPSAPTPYARFITYSERHTTDTDARRERAKFVLGVVAG